MYILFFLLNLTLVTNFANAEITEDRIGQIVEEKIKSYLDNNPEIIPQTLEKAYNKEQMRLQAESEGNIKKLYSELTNTENTAFTGDKKSKNIIIEFYDANCHYCKLAANEVKKLASEKDFLIIFREFPILGGISIDAAKISLAAHKLDPTKYYQFHSELLQTNIKEKNDILKIAETIGYNKAKILKIADEKWVIDEINNNMRLAQEIGVKGAPSFIIEGKLWNGQMIAEAVKKSLMK